MPGESPPSRRCWPSRWLILWATYHEVVRTIAARFNAVCTRTHARRPHPIACALTLGRLLSLPLCCSLAVHRYERRQRSGRFGALVARREEGLPQARHLCGRQEERNRLEHVRERSPATQPGALGDGNVKLRYHKRRHLGGCKQSACQLRAGVVGYVTVRGCRLRDYV